MEPQTRMDPSWRKLRSYSSMANTWRKHTLQSPTLDGRPSSSDIHGLPITTRKLTGLTRVSPCLDALSNRGVAEDDGPEPRDAIYAAFIPPEWAEHHIRATGTPSQRLAQEVQKAEVSQPLKDMVPAPYHDFRDVFSKEAFYELPPRKVWDHAIDLSPGTELPCSRTFPLSPAEQKELDNFLQENLANGCIC